MTDTTLSSGIIQYMDSLTQLVAAHALSVNCPTSSLDSQIKTIMENSYRTTLNHMVNCEASRILKVDVRDDFIAYSSKDVSFSLNVADLRWFINSSSGISISINTNKAVNEVACDVQLEPLVIVLTSLVNSPSPDLLDFAKAKVDFMVKLYELSKVKVDQLQAIIDSQEEQA